MFHLTLQGAYAGRPLCDCNRLERLEAGDEFRHVAYTSDEQIASADCCAECREVWNSPDEEELGEDGIPESVKMAAERFIREGDRGIAWVFHHCMTREERDAVDAWLLATGHPLAYEAGTQGYRFDAIARETARKKA